MVLDDVVGQGLQVAADFFVAGVFFAEVLENLFDQLAGHGFVDLPDFFLLPGLQLAELPHGQLEPALDRLLLVADGLLLLGGQRIELLAFHRFARRVQRHNANAQRRLLHGQSLLAQALVQLLLYLFALCDEGAQQFVSPSVVLFALEGFWQLAAKLLDGFLEVAREQRSPAGGQPQSHRLVGLGEVVDVAPVRGRRLGGRPFGQEARDNVLAAGAGIAGHKNVVALRTDLEAELQGLDRPVLADDFPQRLELPRCAEGEVLAQGKVPQLPVRELFNSHEAFLLQVRRRVLRLWVV